MRCTRSPGDNCEGTWVVKQETKYEFIMLNLSKILVAMDTPL